MPLDTTSANFQSLLQRYGTLAVPRYTSYPTAPQFKAADDDGSVTRWLQALDPSKPVSLYLHIPFCREICWYCGCNMKLAVRDEPIEEYVRQLLGEISLVSDRLPGRLRVAHIHFGGGSPSTLTPVLLDRIMNELHQSFDIEDDAEIASELDPRTVTKDFIKALAGNGFNRISLGIQEFDDSVQKQINRIQPPHMVARVVNQLQSAGIPHLNFDVLYGLPDQTTKGLVQTIETCLSMQPDRFALFGYAHVPWMAKRQRKIREDRLPGLMERAEQAVAAGDALGGQGYDMIGLDHFAKPQDSLAIARRSGALRRNFQGYTSDRADTLIGFGTTAIGATPDGYYQNMPEVNGWQRLLNENKLPIFKQCFLSAEDRLRRSIIEDIMCLRPVNIVEKARQYGFPEDPLFRVLKNMHDLSADGLVTLLGPTLDVTPTGRFFARVIASRFDTYLGAARHSTAV